MDINNQKSETKGFYTIDVVHILKCIASKIWIVIVVSILTAAVGFVLSAFLITPKYSSSLMLYVNNVNNSASGNTTVSSSELSAAQSLVKTYGEILNNRTTLDLVIEQVNTDGRVLDESITYRELSKMIKSSASNNTEVMVITVTCDDPELAADIANAIYPVLKTRIAEIITGASVKKVQDGYPDYDKVSPSIVAFSVMGLVVGALIPALAIAISAMLDKTIHNEEYVLQTLGCPILAKIPNLIDTDGTKHYYRRYYSSDRRKYYDYNQVQTRTDEKEGN